MSLPVSPAGISKSLESLSDFDLHARPQPLSPPKHRVRDLESAGRDPSPRRMSDLPPRRLLGNLRPLVAPKPKLPPTKERSLAPPTMDGPAQQQINRNNKEKFPSTTALGAEPKPPKYRGIVGDGDLQRKVKEVEERVHGVTTEESCDALRTYGGDVKRAVQALKVEQLYNVSRYSKEECRRILEKCQWNLEAASRYVLRRAHPH
ncbi:non-receptor tyrosine-protein kinase TNK1 [Gastrophryne carolinensis]